METKSKIIIGSFIGAFIILAGFALVIGGSEFIFDLTPNSLKGIVSAQSENPEDIRPIGYEFLNLSGDITNASFGEVVHIWNTQYDYFFNKSSGIQFTNHFQDYWTRNIFCLGYYDGDEWIKIKCADELENFNRNIVSDNETYVNATLWKDISYGAYDIRMGIRYHLKTNDSNLSVIISLENIGIDIPFDLGFGWKITDVEIPGLGEDYIDINGTSYLLNDSYDMTFKNMNESYFNIHDITKFLRLDWDESLNDAVKIHSDGQENFYSMLLIDGGHFSPGQEKSTTLYWIDADTAVDNTAFNTLYAYQAPFGPYWSDKDTGVIVYVDGLSDISYRRTDDGGATWTKTEIEAGACKALACWFDKETPGITGDVIHITWADSADENIYYIDLDVATDTLGTKRTVDTGLTIGITVANNMIAITKTRSGNIIIAHAISALNTFKSANQFATSGTSITDPYEFTTAYDHLMLFPASTGDDNDAVGIFTDGSANAISVKMYDDNADNWIEKAVGTNVYQQLYFNMDAAVRHSDGHILLAYFDAYDTIGATLQTVDITPDSTGDPTITAKTYVIVSNEAVGPCIVINQQNDDVYVGWLQGGTWVGNTFVQFKSSDDDMASWVNQGAYGETGDDQRSCHGGRTVGDDGGRIQFSFFNDDLNDIFVNLVNDIEIVAYIPSDTCTYDVGDWIVDCSDYCNITSNVDAGGSSIILNGVGYFNIVANITSDLIAWVPTCKILNIHGDGNTLRIAGD